MSKSHQGLTREQVVVLILDNVIGSGKAALLDHDAQQRAELEAVRRDVIKWKRIRTPTHGNCCTCQSCGLDHDSCRCDLDDVADELTTVKAQLTAREVQVKELMALVGTIRSCLDIQPVRNIADITVEQHSHEIIGQIEKRINELCTAKDQK